MTTYTPYVILVKVAIVFCYKHTSLQETKVLLNMAYQTVDMPPPFCNMTYTNFYDMTLNHALRLCTGEYINEQSNIVGITTILHSAYTPIKDIRLNILDGSVKLSNGFRLTSSSTTLKALSIKRLACINKYTKSLMFLQTFSDVMKKLDNKLTLEQVVKEYSSISSDEATSMLDCWFGNTTTTSQTEIDVRSYTLANISTSLNMSVSEDILPLTMSDVISMVLSKHSAEHMMFLPIKLLKRVCTVLNNDVLLELVREACIKTNLQYVVPYTASDKFTLSQLNEQFGESKVDDMDYVSLKLHINDITQRLQRVIDWPFVASAYKSGVSHDSIPASNLVTLTMDIFKKLTDVSVSSQNVLKGIFGITSWTLRQVVENNFKSLRMMESAIQNSKRLYSLSMRLIYAVMDGDVTKQAFINKALPKCILLISKYNITFLQKVYNFDFLNDIQSTTVISMIENMFGINTATVEAYFDVDITNSPLLNQTNVFKTVKDVMPASVVVQSGILNDKTLFDVLMIAAFTNPLTLIEFLQVTPLSTPTYLKVTTTKNLTLVRDYVTGNKYGITILDMKDHIKHVYYQYEFTSGTEISMVFSNYNLTKMSSYYNIDFTRRKWLDVISYIQKDVAFSKFFDIDFSQWPHKFQECHIYKISCNMFTHFSRSKEKSIEEVRKLYIEHPYAEHVATTDFINYRRLLNLSKWDLWDKSFRFMLYNMSYEYIKLNHSIINTTVIEHLKRTNITIYNATTLLLPGLFNLTAHLMYDRLPYYYYFKGYFYPSYLDSLKDLNVTTMNTFMLKNTEPLLFPGGGILLLSWSQIFDYYLKQVSNEKLKEIRDFRIRDTYFNLTMEQLYELYGNYEEVYLNSSLIQIAENVLGVTRQTLTRITSIPYDDVEVLWHVSINQLKWIMPDFNYNQSTLYEVVNISTYKEVWVLGSTFNMLAQRTNYKPTVNDTTFIELLQNLTDYTAQEIFDLLHVRVTPADTETSMVGKYENMLLYRRGMAFLSAQFNDSVVLAVATKLYQDIDMCLTSELYCNDTYGPSHCVDSSHGYGYECLCVSGYNNFGYECQDIDECAEGHICLDYVTCKNYNGTYDCEGECNQGYCPSNAACTDIAAGPACRCHGSKFYHTTYRECLEGDSFIFVGNLFFLNKTYMRKYGSKNSTEFVDLASYIETSSREHLHASYPSVTAVKVIRIGSTVDFVVVLTLNGSTIFPTPEVVKTLLLDGIEKGTTLEKLLPAANSSLIANALDICAFERPLETGDYCDSEEKRLCVARSCPTDSECVSLYTGIFCRCKFGTFLEGHMGHSETCVSGNYFIEVKDVILPYETYHDIFDNKKSKERLEFIMYLEQDILNFLAPQFPTSASVQILNIYNTGDTGFLKIDFLINFKRIPRETIPYAADVLTAIKSAIKYGTFGTLYVDSPDDISTYGASNLCDLKIRCNDGTTEKSTGGNMGVYIGVPVTIMVVILAVIIYLLLRQKPNRIGII